VNSKIEALRMNNRSLNKLIEGLRMKCRTSSKGIEGLQTIRRSLLNKVIVGLLINKRQKGGPNALEILRTMVNHLFDQDSYLINHIKASTEAKVNLNLKTKVNVQIKS
jgi:hypothetical protein